MPSTRLVLGLSAAAAVLVLGTLALLAGRSGTPEPTPSGRASDGAEASGAPGTSGSARTGKLSPETEVLPPAAVPGAGAVLGRGGVPAPGTRQPPPVAPPRGPLVHRPLPSTSSRPGGLVAGYPATVLPPVPGSEVRSSSVSVAQRRLQVALVGEVRRPTASLAAFYRVRLAGLGFREQPVRTLGGSTGLAFRRGPDSAVLTITPSGDRRQQYSLLGTLHTD